MHLPMKLLIAVAAIASLSGCHGVGHGHHARSHPVHVDKPGPPPHAPAHGYRHKHAAGVDLIFDVGLGVYAVVGHSGVYFNDRHFLRRHGDSWRIAKNLSGPWHGASEGFVPPGLRAKHHKKHKHHGHGKKNGHGPAKHGG